MSGVGLLTLDELVDVLIVVRAQVGVVNRQQPTQPRGFHQQVPDDPLLIPTVGFLRCREGRAGVVLGYIDLGEIRLVAQLNHVEIGNLTLATDFAFDLRVTDPHVALCQRVELADQEVFGETLLERFRGHPK